MSVSEHLTMPVERLSSECDILSGRVDLIQDIYNRSISFGFVESMS